MLKGRFLGMATNVCDKFCYLILTIQDDPLTKSQVLARSVVWPRYKAERAPLVFTRAGTQELVFYKADGKTPLDTPADIDLSENENPLQPYLLEAEEAANETMEESEPPLDDSFEDDIIAVLGPTSKRQKRDHTNENDSMDEIDPALSSILSPLLPPTPLKPPPHFLLQRTRPRIFLLVRAI